jgi:hypothetical protein
MANICEGLSLRLNSRLPCTVKYPDAVTLDDVMFHIGTGISLLWPE